MKGLIIFHPNMEDVEALATKALLVRAGIVIDSITTSSNKWMETAFGQQVRADYFLEEIEADTYDFLIIPGGKYVGEIIQEDTEIKQLAKHFNDQNKTIAAICAGPRFLGQAGLLDNKQFTAFPGSEIDMPKGTYLPHEKAVIDGNIITARGAGVVYDFVYAIIKQMRGESKAKELLEDILY